MGNRHEAFRSLDLKKIEQAHVDPTRNDILEASAIHDTKRGRHIGDVVYGALDGIVTTFAIVSGVAGASLSSGIVLILGFSNLIADGLSMAVGNYLGTKSELEYEQRERAREAWEIEHLPEAERQEVRHIYARKGFTGALLDQVVAVITQNKDHWLETMMLEELHIVSRDHNSPMKSASMTFISFIIAGFVPLMPYVMSYIVPSWTDYTEVIAVSFTFMALFVVGALRVYVTGKTWWKSGMEMLLVGGVVAGVAYLIGYALKDLA